MHSHPCFNLPLDKAKEEESSKQKEHLKGFAATFVKLYIQSLFLVFFLSVRTNSSGLSNVNLLLAFVNLSSPLITTQTDFSRPAGV